ncbi:MAG: ABC transporter ATP-binding protein [Planctomycetes bacterium]|nr:ABC transporter ATP-binding protein [Planctomycetota bacterium]
MSFVSLNGVTKSYRLGEHVVTPLADVSLDVGEGEFLVLLGPSGSGKSTLLNLVAGIDRPDSGTLRVGGTDLASLSRSKLANWRARTVGYVFQDYSLVPVLTAYENVEVPLWLFGMSRADRHRRVSVALEAVGLSDRHRHLPKQLSGGQQQRVAIARAIVADAPLIVADEPTGNLDAESAQDVLHLLERLNRERGKTLLMVTHDIRAVARGTRALRLDKGQLHALEETVS